ncbi:MAG TPA: bifunctional precorrin-2 dehydrogenase/sirohydrochlorin ferrochelatase [Nitrospirota bacterium]|nr:bifunctional precorrin-2 dehydrogenase/sirohydrochlorin ferrochelatase [Nitrospirota bacterium]
MRYYPVFLDLRDRRCLIAGGGKVAERKALSLFEAGADIVIISPTLTPRLRTLMQSGKISHKARPFEDADIAGAYLVIAATDSEQINSHIGQLCRNGQVLVNVASPPEESSFIVPSVVDRGELLIAVSTGGRSPALSKAIRQELGERFGSEYDIFLRKMSLVRDRLREEVTDEQARRAIFQTLVESDVLGLLKAGREHEADSRIAEITGLKEL